VKASLPFFPSFPSQNSPREIGGFLFLTRNRERRGVAVHDSGVWIPYNRRVLRDPLSLSSLRREAPLLAPCPPTGLDFLKPYPVPSPHGLDPVGHRDTAT
jgi:hypothetical protein